MSDKVALQIGGQRIERFIGYRVEADLYNAADAFSLDLADPGTGSAGASPPQAGQRCELYVNGALELAGIVDRVTRGYGKEGSRLRVEGRDIMSVLVDSYCEDFVTIEGKTVKELAEMLIGRTARHPALPFISRKNIVYQENFVGKGKGKKQTVSTPGIGFLDTPQRISQIEPGMTVFEVLRTYAMSRGLMFWMEYGGGEPRFVFGRPKAKGNAAYTLTSLLSGAGNNVLEGEETTDISRGYSKVTVISQSQGHDDFGMDAGRVNSKAIREDASFPFYKPFVARLTNDSQSPALFARLTLEKQRHEGRQLTYRVPGHSQAGTNYRINEIALVTDERLGISDYFLITGRVFERTKAGSFTQLTLGAPGVVA